MRKFLISVLVLVHLHGLAQQYDFQYFSADQGLPSPEVYMLLQDSKGYIWGCTDAGVFRYNGESFTTYTKLQGAPDNTVFNLTEDQHGRIWMTGFNGQVAYFQNDTFHEISCKRELTTLLSNGAHVIYSIGVGDEDTLWLGTTHSLLCIPPEGNYSTLTACNRWCDSAVTVIRQIGNDQVVVSKRSTARNLVKKFPNHYEMTYEVETKFRRLSFNISKSNTTPLYPYNRAKLLSDGRLLVSFFDVLYIIEKNGDVIKKEFDSVIISIAQDKNNDIWVGLTKKGVRRFPNGVLNVEPEKMLEELSVSGVAFDHENGIWISTLEEGICYLKNPAVKSYSYIPGLAETIIETTSIGDTIWAVNNKNEVFIIPRNSPAQQLKTKHREPVSSTYNIYSFDSKIYLCGRMFAVLRMPGGKEEHPLRFQNIIPDIVDMVFIERNKYLIITQRELWEIDNDTISGKYILPAWGTSIAMRNDRTIYVGTITGLYTFNRGAFSRVFPADTLQDARISEVKCMGADLILGTRDKGIFIKRKTGWIQISEAEGLISDHCNSLTIASDSSLWVATNKGISHILFEPGTFTVRNYNSANGLLSNDVSSIAFRGEEVWVGTKKGLNVLSSNSGFFNGTPPHVLINNAVVNDSILVTPNSTLTYNQNNITFFVDGFSFKNTGHITLRYQLVGYDVKEKTGASRAILYQNLPPGEYTFRVFCINDSGVASLIPAEMKFIISQPFWSRWWFIALEISSTIVLFWLLLRWRLNVHRKKAEEKSAVIKKLADFQLTALSAQMSPHFTFNVINSIQRYVLQKQAHDAYTYLGRFSMLMRQVLNNAHDGEISLVRELETLRLYVEMEQLRFENKFDFTIVVDENIDPENVKIPAMLIQPYVENAIWHGVMPLEDKRKGRIHIEINTKDTMLCISVEDNGIGRKNSEQIKKAPGHKSLGMSITRQRLELMSKKTEDQSWKIDIHDLHDNGGVPCGTRVKLSVGYVLKSYLTGA